MSERRSVPARLLVLGGALLSSTCAHRVESPDSEDRPMTFNAYVVLATGELVSANGPIPAGLHLRVWREGDRLEPRGAVEGAGPLGGPGEPGWLELHTRRFVPERAAARPQGPYLEGVMTREGFVPTSREVLGTPPAAP